MVELSTNEREDDLFNVFNEDGLHIGEVKVDINPITAQRTGTLETYLLQAEEYLESIRQEREQELTQQIQTQGEMEKEEVEVTLMVSERGEFHNLGEFYENIPTVEEAIAIWKQIPPERMHTILVMAVYLLTEDLASCCRHSNTSVVVLSASDNNSFTAFLSRLSVSIPLSESQTFICATLFGFSSPVNACILVISDSLLISSSFTALSTSCISTAIPLSLISWSK